MIKQIIAITSLIYCCTISAQDRNFNFGITGYFYNSFKKSSLNLLSNKGASIGYEKRTMLKKPIHLSNLFEVVYWNHCVRERYYDSFTGAYIDSLKFQYSISSVGLSYTPAFSFPFEVKSFMFYPSVGFRSRVLLFSFAKVFNSGNYMGSNKGYKETNHNNFRGFDHLSIVLSHPKLKSFEAVLEADNLLFKLLDVQNGDFYLITDSRYNYYNITLRLCYKKI